MTANSPKHNPLFRNAAKAFLDRGWPANALLPGIPVGAQLHPTSNIKNPERVLGKIPGRYKGGGAWVGLKDWSIDGLAGAKLDPEAVASWPTPQVCIPGSVVCGFDMDCGQDVIDVLMPLFEKLTGGRVSSVRKRDDGSARCMVPFMPDGGLVPPWIDRYTRGAEAISIEIKGRGTQWVGAGRHPTGCNYVWTGAIPDVLGEDMLFLSPEGGEALREAVREALTALGWAPVKATKARGFSGPRVDVRKLPCMVSREIVSAVMAQMPNTTDHFGAIPILSSIRYVLGCEGDTWPEGVLTWAENYEGGDDDPEGWLAGRWFSLDYVEVTQGSFAKWVHENGTPALDKLLQGAINVASFEVDEEAAAELGEPPLDDEASRKILIDRILDQWALYGNEMRWYRIASRAEGETAYSFKTEGFNAEPICRELSSLDYKIRLAAWRDAGAAPRDRPKERRVSDMLIQNTDYRHKLRTVAGAIGSYGDGPLVEMEDKTLRLNTAVMREYKIKAKVTAEDVKPFLDHARALFTSDDERETVLSWMAWVLQNPKEKIRWAVVLHGMQGSGKDTLFQFLADAVGEKNSKEVRVHELEDKYNAFVEKRFVRVGETPQGGKAEFYERFKVMIAGGSGMQSVRRMRTDTYSVVDRCCFSFNTNHENAIAMDPDDRRYYVAATRDMPEEGTPEREAMDAEMLALHKWREKDGWRLTASWLMARDVSALKPNSPPATTQAKRDMAHAAAPLFSRYLQDRLEGDGHWSKRTVLSPGYVVSWVRRNRDADPELRACSNSINDKQVADALRRAGWHSLGQKGMLRSGVRTQITAYVRDKAMLAGVSGPSALVALFLKEEREMPGVIDGSGGYMWPVEDDPKGRDNPN